MAKLYLSLIVAVTLKIQNIHGFYVTKNVVADHGMTRLAAQSDDDLESVEAVPKSAKSSFAMSKAVPFLEWPKVLQECGDTLAGNFGFDPLGFAKNEELLMEYREAEIKHARLAMLAAAGWPLSELFDRKIAGYFGLSSVLDSTDRAPSVLNGGWEQISPTWWGFCLGLSAAIDSYGIQKSRSGDPNYFPGKLGFDPLRLYPTELKSRKQMELAEIKHGRVSMLAVLGYAVQEYSTKLGVVDETPFFFRPILSSLGSE